MKEYYKQLFINKLDNLGEKDKFLERHKLLRLLKKKQEIGISL